jgi:hypothetical protein
VERRCWNCRRKLNTVRSVHSDNEYCIACGAVVTRFLLDAGIGAAAALPPNSRRKEHRYELRYKVVCLMDPDDTILEASYVNISKNGLCLKLPIPLAAEQRIRISDSLADIMVCGTASVRWISKEPDGSYLAGFSCQGN